MKKAQESAEATAGGFTDEERAAMKERGREVRAARGGKGVDDEADVLAKIAQMDQPDRAMAERLHVLITTSAPELSPKTWYGMPGYAKGGKVVCFFQGARKFKTRYATLGFNETAKLDDGAMWPTAFALTELTDDVETRIRELIKRAVG